MWYPTKIEVFCGQKLLRVHGRPTGTSPIEYGEMT